MGFTYDKELLITKTDSGIWVAAGMNGMGIAIGMEAARQVAEKI